MMFRFVEQSNLL